MCCVVLGVPFHGFVLCPPRLPPSRLPPVVFGGEVVEEHSTNPWKKPSAGISPQNSGLLCDLPCILCEHELHQCHLHDAEISPHVLVLGIVLHECEVQNVELLHCA